MRYPSLTPSFDAGARVVFEALAATVEVESRSERQALFPRYARYHALLSRLPRRLRRQLQRKWRRSLAAIALLLALGQAPALAATLTVGPGVAPDIALDGACSLIEAIENANADGQTHLDCPSGGGADILALPASSTQTLTQVHNSTYGYTGLPVVSSAITIEGNGSALVRDPSAPAFRIFAVNGTGNLSLNESAVSGGAQTIAAGQYSLVGGGILVVSGGGLTITNSTVSGNTAGFDGGGLWSFGTVTLMNSTVSGNSAQYDAGGMRNNGTATVTDSTVSSNSGRFSGGVSNYGIATLTSSTVSGNSSEFNGGGVRNNGTATVTNSTISGNTAGFDGGGLWSFGTVTLARSLVSGNTAAQGAEVDRYVGTNFAGTVIANSYNLFGHNGLTDAQAFSGFTPGATDLTATSDGNVATALGGILDTTLANQGGPTQTHEIVAGSPAIDAVATGCPPPATDQRGVGRPQPQGGDCDIGAFERITDRMADLAVDLTHSLDPVTVDQTLAYTMTVSNNGPAQATGVRVTDSLPLGVVLISRPSACTGTSTVTCNLGPLAVGDQTTVTINVVPTVPGTVDNTVSVVANEPDPNPANDSDTETTTVQPPPPADLAITASAAPEPGASGQTLTYTLVVRNNGPATAPSITLTDVLPSGVALGQITLNPPSQGTCGGDNTVVECNLSSLPSGTSVTITIGVIPKQKGVLNNTVHVNVLPPIDPNPENNSATTKTTVEPPLEPTSRATCGTLRCALPVVCNQAVSLGNNCKNPVTLFVRVPAGRLNGELAARAAKQIRFAAFTTNIPPGEIQKVGFKLTKRGKRTAKNFIQQGGKKLTGEMRVSNAAGGIDIIRRLTVRLQ